MRSNALGNCPKLVWTSVAAPESRNGFSRLPAWRIASMSRSAQTSCPPAGLITFRIASECPPPPSVQSAYTPETSPTSHFTLPADEPVAHSRIEVTVSCVGSDAQDGNSADERINADVPWDLSGRSTSRAPTFYFY
eukprot:scaffold59694_cov31-Tisochrysis_lutea.AAC.3